MLESQLWLDWAPVLVWLGASCLFFAYLTVHSLIFGIGEYEWSTATQEAPTMRDTQAAPAQRRVNRPSGALINPRRRRMRRAAAEEAYTSEASIG